MKNDKLILERLCKKYELKLSSIKKSKEQMITFLLNEINTLSRPIRLNELTFHLMKLGAEETILSLIVDTLQKHDDLTIVKGIYDWCLSDLKQRSSTRSKMAVNEIVRERPMSMQSVQLLNEINFERTLINELVSDLEGEMSK